MDQPVGLAQLYDLRCRNDNQGVHGYLYSVIGVDEVVSFWNTYGITEGLMSHAWRDELDRLMVLPRSEGNKLLADKETKAQQKRLENRFQ